MRSIARLSAILLSALAVCCSPAEESQQPPPPPGGDTLSGGDRAGADTNPIPGDRPATDFNSIPGDPATGGDYDGSSAIALGDLCDHIAHAFCDAEDVCCTDNTSKSTSHAACLAKQVMDCQADLMPVLNDSRVSYNATVAGARIGELRTRATTCDATVNAFIADPMGFLDFVDGTVSQGNSCSGIVPDAAGLASCIQPNVCRLTKIIAIFSGQCDPAAGNGSGCFTDLECAEPLRCDPHEDFMGVGGTCQARLANGMGCLRDGDCVSLNCDSNTCASTSVNGTYCLE